MLSLTLPNRPTIYYTRSGHGSNTLVFLHGWTASHREWAPFCSELAQQHQIVCWDARGHGSHEHAATTEMTLAAMADDLAHLLDHINGNKTILVGHSMGALTAWEYIRRYGSSRIHGLCILDQSPKLITDTQWQHGVYGAFSQQQNIHFLSRLRDDFPEAVLELIALGLNARSYENYRNNSPGFQQMRKHYRTLPATLLTACWHDITEQDYRDVLPTLSTPTLLIYGEKSQFYTAALQQWVLAQIPNSTLNVYENADHSPHLYHRTRFINDLNCFIEAL